LEGYVIDLLSLSFEFSESLVVTAIGLGIFVAFGLIIRERVQGAERGVGK
jgi:hypothetical protein